MSRIDKYLGEATVDTRWQNLGGNIDVLDFSGEINGTKFILDDIFEQVKRGNMKTAKRQYKNLEKNVKLIGKTLKQND